MKKTTQILLPLLLLFALVNCKGDDTEKDPINVNPKPLPGAKITSPIHETQYDSGEDIVIEIEVTDAEEAKDLQLFIEDKFYSNLEPKTQTISVPTDSLRVGYIQVKLNFKDSEGKPHADSRNLVIFSDIHPESVTVEVVNTYPHQSTSYTQGLEFYGDKLFEGTGHYNKSILAEVDVNSGTILRQKNLESRYFGEGITILNDTIYQITWMEHTCLLYDMNLNQIGSFEYSGEGWGLTNDGEFIIMTNGSSEIVWRDPRTFEIVKKLDVFNDQSSVGNLNECELIDDRLFVNIYTENIIVEVDTANGKVLREIDCSRLVNEQPIGVDYLNGIAYHEASQKLYITGKWWPKLYQVKIIPWEN